MCLECGIGMEIEPGVTHISVCGVHHHRAEREPQRAVTGRRNPHDTHDGDDEVLVISSLLGLENLSCHLLARRLVCCLSHGV